jgi:flagellar basal-body rod modification protein FlgD
MATNISSTLSDIQSAGDKAKNEAVSAKNGNKLDKNAFLRLLTEQMSHQDPTKPMDNTAFVAQLAQFSSLEAQSNTNDTLGRLLAAQNTSLQNSTVGMVGRNAVFPTDEVALAEGAPAKISADLSGMAGNVTMVVKDLAGGDVRVAQLGPAPAGKNTFEWDGKNDDGDALAPGPYTVTLTAQDLEGNLVPLTQFGQARITSVSFDSAGEATIHAGAVSMPLSRVSEISE